MDILSCSGHAVVFFFFSIGVFVDLFCKRRVLQQLPRACLQAWLKSYERKPVGNAQCFSRCHGQTRKRHDSVLSWLWGLWALWLSIWLHTGAAFQRKTDLKQFCVFELDAVMPFVACLWEGIFKECTAPADFGWLGGCLVSFISLFLAGLETTSLGFWGRSLLFLELACATLLPSFFFFLEKRDFCCSRDIFSGNVEGEPSSLTHPLRSLVALAMHVVSWKVGFRWGKLCPRDALGLWSLGSSWRCFCPPQPTNPKKHYGHGRFFASHSHHHGNPLHFWSAS